jgi:hypothetical protein
MTIFRKNIITLGLAAFGLSAIFVILALVLVNSQYNNTNSSTLLNTAKVLITAVGEERIGEYCSGEGQSSDSVLSDILKMIRDEDVYRLTLLNTNGEVIWDSDAEGNLVSHINRSEVAAAIEGREGLALRDSLSTGMRQQYAALPVYDKDGNIAGVFRLSLAVPGFWQRIAPATSFFIILAGLLALAAFAAVAVFSRSLGLSLRHLVSIAETATGGYLQDTSSHIAVSGEPEEFLVLKTSLQSMVEELNRKTEQAKTEGRQFLAILNGMSEAVLAMDSSLIL